VTFKNLRASYSDYVLREAALNPTNLDDRATEWEVDLINYFRDHPGEALATLELAREPAAVDYKDVAVDVVAGGGSKEDGGSGYILRRAPAGGGDALEDLAGAVGIVLENLGEVGGHVAGGNGIDLNAVGGPLVGEGLGELGDATLGGGISGDGDAALKAEQGSDVDDFAEALGEHEAAGALAETKDTGEIGGKDFVPVGDQVVDGRRAVGDTGVVDEDVDGAEGGDGLVDELGTAVGIAEVGGEFDVANAGLSHAVNDGGGDGFRGVERYVCPRFGEGDGDGGAHSAG